MDGGHGGTRRTPVLTNSQLPLSRSSSPDASPLTLSLRVHFSATSDPG
ncbi:hypothetical protein RB213_011850 [Colletotrichum asianum]